MIRPATVLDAVVLGAGPAGAHAALEAARHGLSVALVDEAPQAGGQVYRSAAGLRPAIPDADRRTGDTLRARIAAAPVTRLFGMRVWQVRRAPDGFTVHACGAEGPMVVTGRALVVAGGALERHLPVAGWQLPGVIGLAGATVLLKAQGMLPGRNVVVAGTGPLLHAVAAAVRKGGGRVAAVVDARPLSAWFREWPRLMSRPDLLARGLGWRLALQADRTPLLHGWSVRSIEGDGSVAQVVLTRHAAVSEAVAPERRIACDAVCLGFGLMPATDVTRLLGAAHAYDEAAGGWHGVSSFSVQ